jgi:hypothetical protein
VLKFSVCCAVCVGAAKAHPGRLRRFASAVGALRRLPCDAYMDASQVASEFLRALARRINCGLISGLWMRRLLPWLDAWQQPMLALMVSREVGAHLGRGFGHQGPPRHRNSLADPRS